MCFRETNKSLQTTWDRHEDNWERLRGLQRDDADGENLSSVDTLSKRGKNVEKRNKFIANIHKTRPLVIDGGR